MNNLQIYSSFSELAHVVDCPRPALCCPSLPPLPLPPLPAPLQALGAAGGSALCLEHPYMPLRAQQGCSPRFLPQNTLPWSFFFCSSAHFHRGTARTRPCGGTFWNFPGSATFSSQNSSGGFLRQYFSVTSPHFLPGCFCSLLRFHHAVCGGKVPLNPT